MQTWLAQPAPLKAGARGCFKAYCSWHDTQNAMQDKVVSSEAVQRLSQLSLICKAGRGCQCQHASSAVQQRTPLWMLGACTYPAGIFRSPELCKKE